jgi:hypothetical protein
MLVGYHRKSIIGYSNWQGSFGYILEAGASKMMLNSAATFGIANGIVPVDGFVYQKVPDWGNTTINATHGITTAISAASKPDIVILGFDFDINDAASTTMTNYIKNSGGVLIMQPDDNGSGNHVVQTFLSAFYTSAGTFTGRRGHGTSTNHGVYPVTIPSEYTANDMVQRDPVLCGPFGNVTSLNMGEDAINSLTVVDNTWLNTSVDALYISASAHNDDTNANYPAIFRDKNYGLMYIGDGGFLADAGKRNSSGGGGEPFWINDDGTPRAKDNHNNEGPVYNAPFFANVMYWAINYAEFYGPNTPTPPAEKTNIEPSFTWADMYHAWAVANDNGDKVY